MNYDISDIFNIDQLDQLMKKFINIAGIGTAILDLNGNVLQAQGWQDICTKFHRVNKESCENCIKSDVSLANQLKRGQKYNIYKCLNGMVDVAVPIYVNKEHIANLFIGQFLLEEPNLMFFKEQAKKYSYDEDDYMEALSKVSVFSEKKVEEITGFLLELATYIGESGYNKFKLQELHQNQEEIIRERTKELEESKEQILLSYNELEEQKAATEVLNKKLQAMMLELKRSNEELEQFAYVASHDLQEPLRMVSSYTQLLANKYKGEFDEKADIYIHYAVDGATRMQNLINNLLDFSRISTRGKAFHLADSHIILGNAIAVLKNTIEETRTIITNGELPKIFCDENQLERVFFNLIGNAIKFRGEEAPIINISAKSEEEKWLFEISDNGIGIDPKYNEKIFVIFQRLHSRKEYEGNGIGLSICKRIVNRHHGEIWLESEPGKGTTFYFTIPKELKNEGN